MKMHANPMHLPIQILSDTNKSIQLLQSIHKIVFEVDFINQETRQRQRPTLLDIKTATKAIHFSTIFVAFLPLYYPLQYQQQASHNILRLYKKHNKNQMREIECVLDSIHCILSHSTLPVVVLRLR
eukprot:512006_1